MTIKTSIKDGSGTNVEAKVTSRGQLVTSPLEFSIPESIVLDAVNIPYTLNSPETGKRFVITDLLLNSNKNVGTAGAIITLYEADEFDGTVSTNDIITTNLGRLGKISLTNLNWIISEGRWVVAQTDDDDVYITIAGYYIDA